MHVGQRETSGMGGCGLPIARGIVEAHGGRIWVESSDGGGAIFAFTVPITSVATSSDPADRDPS